MFNPLVSVIIPTYNRAHTLGRALQSVLNQTYNNYEIIVIDDGSTDDTLLTLTDFPSVQYIKQDNRGVSAARNVGIEQANGEWIALLDSDDEWIPNKLDLQISYLAANPNIKCVHGEEIWIRNGVRVNQMKKHQKGGGEQFIPSLDLCLISPSAVMLEHSLFRVIGNFREDYPVCEDYDLWLKLTANNSIGFISDPIIKKYGGHEDQLSQKYFAMDYYRIKSIHWVLANLELSNDKKQAAIMVLIKKANILLKGYQKHNNLKNYAEIENILQNYIS